MKQPPKTERELRRDEFNAVFDGIPGDDAAKTEKVCSILGYKPHTIRVLRCRKTAWKVIPQAKLDILKRELARERAATAES
jgi:hypothetical protein